MPIVSGRLLPEGKSVSVLRDSGSSTCVVKTGLVSNEQYTGAIQSVRLIDGTLRRFPVARVRVDSPYFCGEVDAVCMPNSLIDVVIGNVEGARGPGNPDLQWVPVGNVQVTQDSHSKGPNVIGESQGRSNGDSSSGCVGRCSIPGDNGNVDAAGETARDVEAVDEDVRSGHDRPCSVGNTNVGQVKVSVSPSGKAQDEADREENEWSSLLRVHPRASVRKKDDSNRSHGSSRLLSIKANSVRSWIDVASAGFVCVPCQEQISQ